MDSHSYPIVGVMDSGLGGLSLVADMLRFQQNMDVLYFADWLNKPYGNKSKDEVRRYVEESVRCLIESGADIIVLACNTATSVAVDFLRANHKCPIFGMEPAIKPALESSHGEKIAVFATELTLKEDRFLSLKNRVDPMNRVIPVACPGLADLVDKEDWKGAEDYIRGILDQVEMKSIQNIVLGCTHYVFLEGIFKKVRAEISLFHGNQGTIRHIFNSSGIGFDLEPQPMLKEEVIEATLRKVKFITNSQNLSWKEKANRFLRHRIREL